MMRLSDDRINHLSHRIADMLAGDERVEFKNVHNRIRLKIKQSMSKVLKQDEEIENRAIEKIRSLSRGVAPGSAEWDILHRQYYEQEIEKLRSIR